MKYLTLLLVCLATSVLGQTVEETFTLITPTGNIEGSLLFPSVKDKKIPLALIIAGSGPTDRDGNNPVMKNNALKMLAEGLAEKNIATLRFDKRGIAKSTSAMTAERDLRFEHYVNDVKAWVDTLVQDDRFSEIIIIGHSEGSIIGMLASQTTDTDKFISLAGPGGKASDKIKEQLAAQSPALLSGAIPIFDELEKGNTVTDIPPSLAALFRPSVQPYLISWFKYNPKEVIAKLKQPVLIIQGTTDLQVNLKDAEQLKQGNPKAQKVIIEGMNHILKPAKADKMENMATYSNPDLPLKAGLLEAIVHFIYGND